MPQIGRLAVRWSRPVVGTPTAAASSCEVDGWSASFSVPRYPLAPTANGTGTRY